MEQIFCTRCSKPKDKTEFYINSIGKVKSRCKTCILELAKEAYANNGGAKKVREYRKNNPEKYKQHLKNRYKVHSKRCAEDPEYKAKIQAQKKAETLKHKEKYMLNSAKKRSLKKGLEFTIDLQDIVIPEFCPLLEVKLEFGTKGDYLYTPSLDRIDSTKGYVKGNVRVISNLANSMKNCATDKELYTFIKNLPAYLENKR